MKNIVVALILLLCGTSSFAQLAHDVAVLPDTVGISIQNKNFVYVAKKMKGDDILLDGILDEQDWQIADKAKNFRLVTPVDSGFPEQASEVMITYNDKAMFIAVVFHDTLPGKMVAESFRRDFSFNNNDNFLSVFDTFRDQTNAYTFGFSAVGALWDGIVTGQQTNLNWDSKMEVEVNQQDGMLVAEIKVPFKSIRYPEGSKVWYANFGRLDLRTTEQSAWAPVPRQVPHA